MHYALYMPYFAQWSPGQKLATCNIITHCNDFPSAAYKLTLQWKKCYDRITKCMQFLAINSEPIAPPIIGYRYITSVLHTLLSSCAAQKLYPLPMAMSDCLVTVNFLHALAPIFYCGPAGYGHALLHWVHSGMGFLQQSETKDDFKYDRLLIEELSCHELSVDCGSFLS